MLCHEYNCIDCIQTFYFPIDDDTTVYYGNGHKKEPHPYELHSYACPLCRKRMEYCSSCDLDMDTCKIIGDSEWVDEERKKTHPRYDTIQPTTTTITCPYCKSTNTKKISGLSKAGSVALWGIFALGKTTKQFHCNNCKADF